MDKRKLVEDLVSTFEDRSALHAAYKQQLKGIILMAIQQLADHCEKLTDHQAFDPADWVDAFVERTCKRDDEEDK